MKRSISIVGLAALAAFGSWQRSAHATWSEDYESYSPGPLGGSWTFDVGTTAHSVMTGIGWNGSQGITGPSNSVTWMTRTFDNLVPGESYQFSFKMKPDTGDYVGAVLGGGSGLYMDLRYWTPLPTSGLPGLLYYNAELYDQEIVFTTTEWIEARSNLTPSGGGWLQVDEYRVYNSGANDWDAWQLLGQTTVPWNFEAGRNYVRTAVRSATGVLDDVAFVVPQISQPGDFDGDGDVDGADFVAWQTNFPKASGALLEEGDADGDGDVDGADFVVWQTNFPFTPSGGVTQIPEPKSLILLICGATFVLLAHRKIRPK